MGQSIGLRPQSYHYNNIQHMLCFVQYKLAHMQTSAVELCGLEE